MKLYFSPLACSLATRIALYEAGADATFVEVDPKTKELLGSGGDYRAIHPLGLVPTLEHDGELFMENAAILQLIAELYPQAQLAPGDATGRARLRQWLCFVGTELHKPLFVPLLDKNASPEVKAYALAKGEPRLDWLNAQLAGRSTLLDEFSVADAYLFTVLNWAMVTPVDLKRWPNIRAYHEGMRARSSVARAFATERDLYAKELQRHGLVPNAGAAAQA